MIRREFLRNVLYGGTVFAATGASAGAIEFGDETHMLPVPVATEFALEDVRILDPDLLRMRKQTLDYMLALDADRLLHNFRVTANLPTSAQPLYNRESPTNGWRGHYVGHFLSASAQMYATTSDQRVKAKAEAMIAELAKCQAQLGDKGYLSAFPESDFENLEAGRPAAVLWYALHKIMAGLLDCYEHLRSEQALQIMEKMAAW